MQTAVLSGGNASATYSGLPLRGCYRRLDFELVACCCVILLLAPSVVILVYDYYKVGDSLYMTPFLSRSECRNISTGPVSIVTQPKDQKLEWGSNVNLTCRANEMAYWQWFQDGEVTRQFTDYKTLYSTLKLINVTKDVSAFSCMSFLADPFCDLSPTFYVTTYASRLQSAISGSASN